MDIEQKYPELKKKNLSISCISLTLIKLQDIPWTELVHKLCPTVNCEWRVNGSMRKCSDSKMFVILLFTLHLWYNGKRNQR